MVYRASKLVASYLPKDFQPRPEDYQAQGVSQIPRDFLDVVVTPEFIEYWTELRDRGLKKGKKDAWYTTWRNRARFLWAKRGPAWEENRHKYRQAGGERKDFFDTMLDKINGSAIESRRAVEAISDSHQLASRVQIGAAANPINGSQRHSGEAAPDEQHKRDMNSIEAAAPIAAPMDPLEALKEMQKIIESA